MLSKTKYIAWYLPQFHEIPENNEWWGNGFTDWTNVTKARPRFKNHNQPRIPLNNNYYKLDNIDNIQWQANLMKKYDIYGLCIYHYWFKDGKKLLEKPAEMILNNKHIQIKYCFSWANEPWTRAWDGKTRDVIMPQEYGAKKEWKDHFNYLLPFFKDSRYIKMNKKPVFVIYKSESIPDLAKMIEYWNDLAKENGLEGIYFINTLRNNDSLRNTELFNANVEFEPFYSTGFSIKGFDLLRRKLHTGQLFRSYTKIVNKSLKQRPIKDQVTIPGLFIDWDNTPRKDPAFIFRGFSIDKFKNYLHLKLERCKTIYNSEYLFINAWNEWAEGTYMEPDEKYGYKVLETLKEENE